MKTAFISDTGRKDHKQFGFLTYSTSNLPGNSSEIIFLKDDISRSYPEGTLVTFELQTRKVTYDRPTVLTANKEQNFKAIDEILSKDLRLIEIEVATKVRALEEDLEQDYPEELMDEYESGVGYQVSGVSDQRSAISS